MVAKGKQHLPLGLEEQLWQHVLVTEVVTDGQNGFVCATPDQWYTALQQLLAQPALRAELGIAARRTIVERYSVEANIPNFLALFGSQRLSCS